jgi:uncharacterized repeat protein (TIGR03847 family)
VVWLEKEQLFQVGISVKQFTASKARVTEPAPFAAGAFPQSARAKLEFKAGDMSLRHDPATDVFTLSAANFNEDAETAGEEQGEKEQPVEVLVSFSRAVAERLADRALEVVAAGRPPCPLCGAPQDPGGHFCVKKNGHRREEPRSQA